MTEDEKRRLKGELIIVGFWGADELGDPTADWLAVDTLTDRMQALLGPGSYLTLHRPLDQNTPCSMGIINSTSEYVLASAGSFYDVACLAAVAMPEFLKQHPECAATRITAPGTVW